MDESLLSSYRSTKNNEKTSDEDSDDSLSESEIPWKRQKTPASSLQQQQQNVAENKEKNTSNSQRKKNNIWGSVLSEQSLSENLGGVGVTNVGSEKRTRSVESYNYWLKDKDERLHRNPRKRSAPIPFIYHASDSDEEIGFKIAERLKEPKQSLIVRVVNQIGRKLSVQLLHKTEEIESCGGMLVQNKSRRRTTGGVFFQLLHEHSEVTRAQLDYIFQEEKKITEQHKKKIRSIKRRQKANAEKEKLKDLPTVVELALKTECTE